MKLLEWFVGSGSWNKNEFICQSLWKDICLDIGKSFKNTENDKEISITELQLTGNKQLGEFGLQIVLPVYHKDENGCQKKINPIVVINEQCETSSGYITEVIKRNFTYAVAIKDPEFILIKGKGNEKVSINYTIYLDLNEDRILPLSRKIKKSILKCRDTLLINENQNRIPQV